MAVRRRSELDLRRAILEPGFTPAARDAGALLDLLVGDEEIAPHAERALLRAELGGAREALRRAEDAKAAGRPAILRYLGRLAAQLPARTEAIRAALVARLEDSDERVRRAAAGALGKAAARNEKRAGGEVELAAGDREAIEGALTAAIAREPSASAKRAMIEALGKIGGAASLGAIGADSVSTAPGEDRNLERARAKAALIVTREIARETPTIVDVGSAPSAPLAVALRCRAGLEPILLDELPASLKPRLEHSAPGGTRVEVTLRGAPAELFVARTMLSFAFPLGAVAVPASGGDDALAGAVAASLASPEALAILRQFTRGPLRYRLAWASGGKRRATVWRVAEEVARRCPELVNDPTESPWEAEIHEGSGRARVELRPRVDDPRFAYRRGDVPAASHPTIAAALARVGGVEPDDVVWDPFVGSGTELCERALAGPYRRLAGSDLEPAALATARANLDAAGARDATLARGDATSLLPPGGPPTLILTNPPLGRRVQRSADLAPMIDRFLEHAARVLAPGGRLVWISPFAARTRALAARLGLTSTLAREVDMGGFSAELQAFRKRGGAAGGRGSRAR